MSDVTYILATITISLLTLCLCSTHPTRTSVTKGPYLSHTQHLLGSRAKSELIAKLMEPPIPYTV